MKNNSQSEKHFMASDVVRDIVLGMSDGLTVPFAIAAGMSGASVSASIVIIAGLAEIAAGSISMGLGGFLAGRSEVEHYQVEEAREKQETLEVPDLEVEEVKSVFRDYGLDEGQMAPVVKALVANPEKWVEFMMRFELGLTAPDPRRAWQSAITIALSYAISGFIPLSPYILLNSVNRALYVSAGVTLTALFVFGYIKGRITGISAFRSAVEMLIVGGIAAGAAFLIARWIG
ncbi:MAG: VIT1/CCC1 transporter family protein [Anaerolineales bacterium]|jgi:VIT1/CCC1 family predicted Fe2+/Mn2+ transporter